MTFKDIFPGLSRTLSFNFQDFPGPKWFSRIFQILEFSRKKSRTFQEAWEPCKTMTVRAWSSLLFQHPARKRSGSIFTTLERHGRAQHKYASWISLPNVWFLPCSIKTCSKTVTHTTTNHVQCSATSSISRACCSWNCNRSKLIIKNNTSVKLPTKSNKIYSH